MQRERVSSRARAHIIPSFGLLPALNDKCARYDSLIAYSRVYSSRTNRVLTPHRDPQS